MTFRWIPVVLTVTAALLAASCSNPGRGDPEAIRPIPTTTPVTTTSSTTTSTTATTLATTTTSSSTSTTTTQAFDPEAATKQEIADVVVKAREAYLRAGTYPVDPELPELSQYYSTEHAAFLTDRLRQLKAQGLAYRSSDRNIESITVVAVQLVNDTEAAALACLVSDVIEYRVETSEITDDSVFAELRTYIVTLDGERWTVSEIQLVQQFDGAESCEQ